MLRRTKGNVQISSIDKMQFQNMNVALIYPKSILKEMKEQFPKTEQGEMEQVCTLKTASLSLIVSK